MKGWILDIYPDMKKKKMVLWVKTNKGCHKILEDYNPLFYVKAADDDYQEIADFYGDMGFKTDYVMKKTSIYDKEEKKVLEISPGKLFDPRNQADALEFFNGYHDYEFYNIDIPMGQRYLIENQISPLALVHKKNGWQEMEKDVGIYYSSPLLRNLSLEVKINSTGLPSMGDKINSVKLGKEEISGSEREIIEGLNRAIKIKNPDVILTSGGDSFLIPYLFHRAQLNDTELLLGRERSLHKPRQGSSYISYGRVIYKPPSYYLKGRIHIDIQSSFMFREGGLDGLIEISRLSKMSIQNLARRSPGSAIDAMELEQAMKDGYLIPWKKNISESFKTARQMMKSDRGGHIFEPAVGVHFDVLKLDFASMYPSIIDKYNLSPETLRCSCGDHHVVPELGYRICNQRRGLIPKVVAPIIERRQKYKKITEGDDVFSRRADTLKWLLVTCFGYTGYKKARFSNIEVHESVTAYGRDVLITAADIAQKMGYEVIHGIVDSLWLKGDEQKLDELIERVNDETDLLLEKEGTYSWVAFLSGKSSEVGVPNRYFGVLNGELEMKGIHAKRSDTPKFFKKIQRTILNMIKDANNKEELEDNIYEVLDLVKTAYLMLKREEIDYDNLYFTKNVSKKAEDYCNLNESKAALLQYEDMDISVNPGETIRYIVTDYGSGDYDKKVKVEGSEIKHYDTKYYTKYLYRMVSEILSIFGYDENKVEKAIKTTYFKSH